MPIWFIFAQFLLLYARNLQDFATMGTKNRDDLQHRLIELNGRFLAEVERGAGWSEVKGILEDMKEIAKHLDHIPATIIDFDNYPMENTRRETGR